MCTVYQTAGPKAQRLHATWQVGNFNWGADIKPWSCVNEGGRSIKRMESSPSSCSAFPRQLIFLQICITFAGLCSPALPVVNASIKYDGDCFPYAEKEEMVHRETIRTSLFQVQQITEKLFYRWRSRLTPLMKAHSEERWLSNVNLNYEFEISVTEIVLWLVNPYCIWWCVLFAYQTRTWVCLKATSCFWRPWSFWFCKRDSAKALWNNTLPPPHTLVCQELGYNPREVMPVNFVDIIGTAKPFNFYLGAVLMKATFRNLVKQLHAH